MPENIPPLKQQEDSEAEADNTASNQQKEAAEKEPLRILHNVGDLFLSTGVIFLIISFVYMKLDGYYNIFPVILFFAISEWLVRKRQTTLPGVVLLCGIALFTIGSIDTTNTPATSERWQSTMDSLTVVTLIYFLRYRTPFALLPLTAFSFMAFSIRLGLDIETDGLYLMIVYGVLVFTAAMWCDSRDIRRTGRMSDFAFWLHIAAAPLLCNGLTLMFLLSEASFVEYAVFVLFLCFFMIALFVDRRTILVSSTIPVIFHSVDVFDNVAGVMLGFGFLVIFAGAYWNNTRNFVFYRARDWTIARYVPPFALTNISIHR